MGQEIADSHFTPEDFAQFSLRLQRETELLEQWLEDELFSSGDHRIGYELEAWLIDERSRPLPVNQHLLQQLNDPLVVPELARFNLEFNGTPLPLDGLVFSRLAEELTRTWSGCNGMANDWGARLVMIGILPTVEQRDLTIDNMSDLQRYRALDEQLSRLRRGAPLVLEIGGRDRLSFRHDDVMLESATTSFQIHLKVDPGQAGRFYNASKILAAPMVAVSANSPYLFGAELWDETRIPLFEQAVQTRGGERSRRVSLGTGYVSSIGDCFRANLEHHQVLLPQLMDEPAARLSHLRLHNGTVWRWVRPLIGFDPDGAPHIRIEQRVVPAGPTIIDCMANMAFYAGMVYCLARQHPPPEQGLAFEQASRNFYQAARHGLQAEIAWLDGRPGTLKSLCQSLLLPLARRGLDELGVDRHEADYWLGIIAARLASGQNGAVWQRAWVARHGPDMARLTEAYVKCQESARPIHQWPV